MASIRKHRGKWQARYRDPDGAQRAKSFPRKIDAQRFLATVEADILRGSYVDPAAGAVTFGTFAEEWLASQTLNAKTLEGLASHLRAHLVPAFGTTELRAIRPSSVQQWMKSVSHLEPSTVRLLLTTLSWVLGAAVEDGKIAHNPCRAKSVRPPSVGDKRVKPWPVQQVTAVIAALPDRYQATAIAGAGLGLRQGEAFGLRVSDVDFLRQQVEVRQQVKHVTGQGTVIAPPKRGKTRTVPLPDSVAVALSEHLRAYPADDLLFTNSAGGPINRGAFNSRAWRPALLAAGVDTTRDNGFHALRHHYASVLLDGGVSIRALADWLGHNDPGFTLRTYTHLMPASADRAREAVDAAFSRGPDVDQAVR